MVILDASIINIALPSAQRDLGFTNNDRQWVVTAYSLTFGSLLILGGRVSDMLGSKITFIVGLVGFAGASALGGGAGTFASLIAARALQGVFAALLIPAARSLLTTTFAVGKDRAKAFGVFSAVAGAGATVGLLLGGLLTEHLGWRWTLYVNLVFAAIALVGSVTLPGRTRRGRTVTLDVPGALLVSAGLFAIVFGLSNAQAHTWGSVDSWGYLVAGSLLLVSFTWWQTMAAHPLLPLYLVMDRSRGASYLSVLIVGSGLFGVLLFLTYYLQQIRSYTPIATGLAFLPMVAAMMVASIMSTTVLVPRFGPRVVVPTGMGLAAVGLIGLTKLGPHSAYTTEIMPLLIIVGIGFDLAITTGMSLSTYGVAPKDSGVASAAFTAMQQFGGSIGATLLNELATSTAHHYIIRHDPHDPTVTTQSALHSYAITYWWSAVLFTAGLVVCALLYRPHAIGGAHFRPVHASGTGRQQCPRKRHRQTNRS
jgi:EmrB/QacA subfamily drug resistance transporter